MEQTKQNLMESIFEVFEKMLYVFLEPTEEPGSDFEIEAEIEFRGGAVKGDLRFMLSHSLARQMAENMLGTRNSGIDDKSAGDCAKEAVNMICGNFLSKYDKNRVFNLSIPVLRAYSGERAAEARGQMYKLDFNSDSGKIGIDMTMAEV
jgi:CheY-specific phosphatase CheX